MMSYQFITAGRDAVECAAEGAGGDRMAVLR